MNVMQEIMNLRSLINLEVDKAFDEFIKKAENRGERIEIRTAGNYETIYPITVNPAIFKGKKPTAVIFSNERIDVTKWKTVVEKIMSDCNADPEKHVALMNLRGKISGRERVLLSKEIGNMRSAIKIDENLYIETNYDTESLLRILLHRILDEVDFDYSKISVAVRH